MSANVFFFSFFGSNALFIILVSDSTAMAIRGTNILMNIYVLLQTKCHYNHIKFLFLCAKLGFIHVENILKSMFEFVQTAILFWIVLSITSILTFIEAFVSKKEFRTKTMKRIIRVLVNNDC